MYLSILSITANIKKIFPMWYFQTDGSMTVFFFTCITDAIWTTWEEELRWPYRGLETVPHITKYGQYGAWDPFCCEVEQEEDAMSPSTHAFTATLIQMARKWKTTPSQETGKTHLLGFLREFMQKWAAFYHRGLFLKEWVKELITIAERRAGRGAVCPLFGGGKPLHHLQCAG